MNQQAKKKPRLVICVAFWGPLFRRRFVEWNLPTLLAPGNVPALAQALDVRLLIITSDEDRALVSQSPLLKRMADHVEVVIERVPEVSGGDKYRVVTGSFEMALRIADAWDARLFITNPDSVYADGALSAFIEPICAGKQFILGTAISVDERSFERWMKSQHFPVGEGVPLLIPPRALVRGIADNLSREESCRVWGAPEMTVDSGQVHWMVADQGFVTYTAQLAPLVSRSKPIVLESTYDVSMLRQNRVITRDCAFMSDSDAFCCAHIVGDEYQPTYTLHRPGTAWDIARWLRELGDRYHRRNMRRPIFYHSEAIDPLLWQPVITQSSQTMTFATRLAPFMPIVLWLRYFRDVALKLLELSGEIVSRRFRGARSRGRSVLSRSYSLVKAVLRRFYTMARYMLKGR